MFLAFALDLGVALLTAFLLDRLRRSKHPLARKLLGDVGSRWDPTHMGHAQLKSFGLRFLLFGLAACGVAALILVLSASPAPGSLMQAAAVVAGVTATVVAIMSLINAGHFALIAFGRRAAPARSHVHFPTVPPIAPE
jgi:hypothetical protein